MRRPGALAALVLAALMLLSPAAAANQPATEYVDRTDGFAITIPTAWKLVPRSLAEVRALVAADRKHKSTLNLADAYASIIATSAGRAQLTAYKLQAFDWPGDYGQTPILTEVYVGVVKTKTTIVKRDLPAIGDTYANALSANSGAKIDAPKEIELPAGPAEEILGTVPAGQGLASGVELYLVPHGSRLYELGFQIDARALKVATLFTSIAQHFRFA